MMLLGCLYTSRINFCFCSFCWFVSIYFSDTFGRLWFPLEPEPNDPVSSELKTSAPSIDITGVPNKPPAHVMTKALSQDIISLSAKTLPLAGRPIYLALYFSEPQSLGRTMKRSFNVFLDNEQLNSVPIVPVFGKATEFVTREIVATWQSKVIFRSTSDSTLPPIVNAMELYSISKGVGGDYGGGGQSGDDTDDRDKGCFCTSRFIYTHIVFFYLTK